MQGTFKKSRAFTLVELLVVISIIAMLLAILMPALRRVRSQAQQAVCGSNLHQWAIIMGAYAADYNGKFHMGRRRLNGNKNKIDPNYIWLNAYRAYQGEDDTSRVCPSAKKIRQNTSGAYHIGGGALAWLHGYVSGNYETLVDGELGNYGSLGINGYICSDQQDDPQRFVDENRMWKSIANAHMPSTVPVIFDSAYWKIYPEMDDNPAFYGEDYLFHHPTNVHTEYMAAVLIDRHLGSVQMLFMDMAVKRVPLLEMYKQNWYRGWVNPELRVSRWRFNPWIEEVSR